MTSEVLAELETVQATIAAMPDGPPKGQYDVPWYLVVGEPKSGKSSAVLSMNVSWVSRDAIQQPRCHYFVSKEAIFIEPQASAFGPSRNPGALRDVCEALSKRRPREPMDGVLLVVNTVDLADGDENTAEDLAVRLRAYLVEVGQALEADVPVYILVTGFDTLWGFGDVFAWTPDRAKEEAWGFLLPVETPSQQAGEKIDELLSGLAARCEGFCLAKMTSDADTEARFRAFQHLAEIRQVMEKLRAALNVLGRANAYERAPWIRALVLGSCKPSTGMRIRAGLSRFVNMGLAQGPAPVNQRPGGLPMHAFMRAIVLKERDLVPLRVRWRDDPTTVIGMVLGVLLILGAAGWWASLTYG